MKRAHHVPRLAEMLPTVAKGPAAALRVLDAARTLKVGERAYRHWDKVRYHRPVPSGFTALEWWCALKVLRAATARTLPLVGVGGLPVHVTSPPGLSDRLGRISRRLSSPHPVAEVPGADQAELRTGLFRESLSSSLIEGARTDRAEALQLLTAARPPRDLGERMVLNNYQAMRRVAELAGSPMTPARLLGIQALLTEGTLRDAAQVGRFRAAADRIVLRKGDEVVFVPPPAEALSERIETLCAFANATEEPVAPMDPVLRAILLHYWLAYDHPFADGNGRTARALFYWSMLRSGHPLAAGVSLSSAILADTGSYYRAFRHAESDGNDATYFVLNQVESLERALGMDAAGDDDVLRYVEESRPKGASLPRGLNARQRFLVAELRRNPGSLHTLPGYRELHGVTHMTAWRDLEGLRRRRLLVMGPKQGRAATYVAPPLRRRDG